MKNIKIYYSLLKENKDDEAYNLFFNDEKLYEYIADLPDGQLFDDLSELWDYLRTYKSAIPITENSDMPTKESILKTLKKYQ